MARSTRAALITETDPYKVLGLTPAASGAEIEKARRRTAAAHHPDTGPASERAEREAAMKRINVAYELLRDPAARAAYDLTAQPATAGTMRPARRPVSPPAPHPSPARPRRRRPRRSHSTAVLPLELLRAIGFVLAPLLASRGGLYLLLLGAITAAVVLTPSPDQIGAALTVATVALLLPPLLLRRLRGTPLADLLSVLEELIRR